MFDNVKRASRESYAKRLKVLIPFLTTFANYRFEMWVRRGSLCTNPDSSEL
jgi:hypothetical protein